MAAKGKKVSIVRAMGTGPIAGDVGVSTRPFLIERLRNHGVRIEPNVKAERIISYGVAVTREDNKGFVEFIEADSIVLAPPSKPNSELAEQLRGKVPELHIVGDCAEPGRIVDAIREGFRVGREL